MPEPIAERQDDRFDDLLPVLENHWRLEALQRTGLLDSPPEGAFDRQTRLAARVMGTPIALVSLIDDHRQFFKSCVGLAPPLSDTRETPLSHSFCKFVVGLAEALVVRDACTDPMLRGHPAVVEFGLRAYAGMPLMTTDGAVIGTLCVADRVPRDWSEDELAALRDLADGVMTELHLRERLDHEAMVDEAIGEQTARLRLSLEAGELGVFAQEPDAERLLIDEGFARLFGLPPAPSGSIGAWLSRIDPQDRAAVETGLATLPARGQPRDVMLRTRTGARRGPRWIRLRARPERRGPRGVALFGVAMDVTDRQRAELQRAEADRRKDQFLAMLAHELRNPLAPIRSGAQAIGAMPPGDERIRAMSRMIERQVTHLARLVSDLLDVSRITQGKVTLRREPMPLAAAIEQGVELAAPLVAQRRHVLKVDAGDRTLLVDGDATRLAQVFDNLIGNAAKFTPPGGHIDVTLNRDGGDAVVHVRDDGIGIAPEMLPDIFELFTQVPRPAEGGTSGLGIGLSLVRSLVTLHGGSVRADSAGPGRGACFEVRLPLVRPQVADRARPNDASAILPRAATRPGAASPSPSSASQSYPTGITLPAGMRLLIVDDHADAAVSLAAALSVAGATVRTANDGRTALAMLADWMPQAALLDIGMPDMDGHALARAIRAVAPDVLLVAVTGYGQDADRDKARAAGFDHHLVKPVDLATLSALLGCG